MVSVRDSVSCYIHVCNVSEIWFVKSWTYIEIYGTDASIQSSDSFYGVKFPLELCMMSFNRIENVKNNGS